MNKHAGRICGMVICMLLFAGQAAVAWGPAGHELIALIANYYLTPVARENLEIILGDQRLSDHEVCMWPDIVRGTREYEAIYPGNARWHYVEFDIQAPYNDEFELKLPGDGHDIASQIVRWSDELGASDTPQERKLDALRFLVHFVGDVHQPLHCGSRFNDRGGNMLPVNSFQGMYYSFDADTPMDYPPSLHSVWDDSLVVELLAGSRPRGFARRLRREIPAGNARRWMDSEPFDWARESYWHARKDAYRWADGESLPFKWTRPGMDLTSGNYIDSKLPIVRERLQKGGVRLAHLLNRALDPDSAAGR